MGIDPELGKQDVGVECTDQVRDNCVERRMPAGILCIRRQWDVDRVAGAIARAGLLHMPRTWKQPLSRLVNRDRQNPV